MTELVLEAPAGLTPAEERRRLGPNAMVNSAIISIALWISDFLERDRQVHLAELESKGPKFKQASHTAAQLALGVAVYKSGVTPDVVAALMRSKEV
ncbi:MAG TPA: hypothetical protein VFW90_02950 [Candidatus Saccharimonadales bacterium]|nr:hypothetical protein [Candidatus Saccharimonadales bacterium]